MNKLRQLIRTAIKITKQQNIEKNSKKKKGKKDSMEDIAPVVSQHAMP